jgi:hypothetical protein
LTAYRICTQYYNGLQGEVKKQSGKRRKENWKYVLLSNNVVYICRMNFWLVLCIYLFVVYLVMFFSVTQTVQHWMKEWFMNWKRCRRKQSCPNLWDYPSICLEGLRKTTKNLSQDSQSLGWDLNHGPPKYEAGVLTTQPWRLVTCDLDNEYINT